MVPALGGSSEIQCVFSASEKGYADSPRGIEAEMLRRGMPIRRQWLLPDGAQAPDGVEMVPAGTDAARAALEAADYIVSNTYLLQRFETKPGALYVQTWHGTPLKRIGHNINLPRHLLEYEVTSRDDARRWDYLIAPNAFTADIMRTEYPGPEVLETGYPRNDLLLAADAEERRASLRAQLGISDEVAVLYAPTFRDDDLSVRFGLDPATLGPLLDPGHVVLARSHINTGGGGASADHPAWRDVTGWPDIADLYLAADVLITDYSSCMFDFAVTGKPQLFYTYDLEDYRDRLRGFYFDFEAEAPGPLLRTPEQVAAALHDLGSVSAEFAQRYEAFRARFCHWDDGRAGARVVDAMLARSEAPQSLAP